MRTIIIMLIVLSLSFSVNSFAADEWAKLEPLGTRDAADIDDYITVNNEALDRLLSNYQICNVSYASVATLTVGIGEVVCSNSGGTVRKFRKNTSATTVTWANIDVSSEGSSTTYYVHAVADTDATTFTVVISTSATAPTGVTYFKKIGSFYNNSDGNIEQISDGIKMKMSIGTGTVANEGTVPLPTGYAESECSWMPSINSMTDWDGAGDYEATFTCSIDTSRVATVQQTGSQVPDTTADANYIIIGYRDND